MKKIFTLLAATAMVLTASAQNEYKADGENITKDAVLVDNNLIKISAFSDAKGGAEKVTICSVDFDGFFQLRNDNPDPTPDTPIPGVQDGSTALSVESKGNVELSVYYRRQKGNTEGGHVAGDNKDLLCKNITTGELVENVLTLNDPSQNEESYAYAKGTFTLNPGNYVFYRRGSTMRVFGFTWVGEVSAITDIAADENAPVEYFNLQGVRVDNPSNGIFIKRQGSNVSKVVVK